MVIRKILAIALMATSVGAMASPRSCLFKWVQDHHINVISNHTDVPDWGSHGAFDYHNHGLIMSYRMTVDQDMPDVSADVFKAPWDCHCTLITVLPKPGDKTTADHANGICGRW